MLKIVNRGLCVLLSAALVLIAAVDAAALPSPKTGGVDGKAINLLMISQGSKHRPPIDPEYEKALKDAGYNL
ncbi:MAG: hypothetical protein ACYTGH_16070, partial [Planctomycetota bacterium]